MEHTSSSGESKDPAVVYGSIPAQTVAEIKKICQDVINEECDCGPSQKEMIALAKKHATVTHTHNHGIVFAVLFSLLWLSGAWYFAGYHNQKHMGDVTVMAVTTDTNYPTYWFRRPNGEMFTAEFRNNPRLACGSHWTDLVYRDTGTDNQSIFVKAQAPANAVPFASGSPQDSSDPVPFGATVPGETYKDPRKGH